MPFYLLLLFYGTTEFHETKSIYKCTCVCVTTKIILPAEVPSACTANSNVAAVKCSDLNMPSQSKFTDAKVCYIIIVRSNESRGSRGQRYLWPWKLVSSC